MFEQNPPCIPKHPEERQTHASPFHNQRDHWTPKSCIQNIPEPTRPPSGPSPNRRLSVRFGERSRSGGTICSAWICSSSRFIAERPPEHRDWGQTERLAFFRVKRYEMIWRVFFSRRFWGFIGGGRSHRLWYFQALQQLEHVSIWAFLFGSVPLTVKSTAGQRFSSHGMLWELLHFFPSRGSRTRGVYTGWACSSHPMFLLKCQAGAAEPPDISKAGVFEGLGESRCLGMQPFSFRIWEPRTSKVQTKRLWLQSVRLK